MEAARIAALRGHGVTLYESQDKLGGQWRSPASPWERIYADLLKHLEMDYTGVS
jgi:NADPH-dependent 2,4-dienoyl-CoA reductase/sulfur reductase-like enzyme